MNFFPEETLPSEQVINADKQILSNTDYTMLKAFEHILQADSLEELLVRIQYARANYAPQLELRQTMRDEINDAEVTLVSEQKERDIKMQEMIAAEQEQMLGNEYEEL